MNRKLRTSEQSAGDLIEMEKSFHNNYGCHCHQFNMTFEESCNFQPNIRLKSALDQASNAFERSASATVFYSSFRVQITKRDVIIWTTIEGIRRMV